MAKRSMIIIALVAVFGVVGWMVAAKVDRSGELRVASASAPVKELLEQASARESEGQKIKAKEAYEKIIADHPDYEQVEEVQERLGTLNLNIITSNTDSPHSLKYRVVQNDSLGKLAKKYNTTKELIKKSNGLSSDVIRVGQSLRIWTAPFSVIVDKSQNILMLKTADEVVKIYRVSTGANNITPVGSFKIATKLANPVWFKPGSNPIPAESPENVLGSRWMGFDTDPHYGIHGTTEPEKIGQQVTAGCVRMRNADVEELFDLLPTGAPVVIQD